MSKVDIDPADQGDIPPTPSTGPSNAPVPLPYDEWVPAGEPVGQLPEGQDFYECFLSNAAGQFLNTYTMRVDSPYSFEASDRLGTNQSVAAFELEGVLFNRNQLFASQAPPSASLNGATLVTATWVPGPRQHCVRATWTLDVLRSGGYLRNGTFRIESASADTVLYVRSAVLRLNGESTNQNNSSVSASTNATETALSTPVPASSSSTPNLGVIIPAILVPIFAIAGVIVAFVFWRRRQQHRRRLAPSAAFRQDHAATIARGVEGHGAASPVPSNANAYIPLDEKRSFNFS